MVNQMDIEEILQKLNAHQKQAVLDNSHCALVNAVVGSGKTTVLTAKVLYLHHCRQVPLTEMAVITFTNKAADEIRERLTGCPDMPWLGTFHSVAMRMLQTALSVESLGYTPTFTIMDPDELIEAAIGLVAEHKLSVKYTNKLPQRLESFRAGNSLFGAMKTPDDIGRLWELLQQEKHRQNRMDFDDLLANALRLAAAKPAFVRWVIVDEFQDCDELQLSFIRSLAGPDTQLFVVGDPSQSIYTWRGGKPRIFSEFKKEFSAAEFSLPVNYRSSGTILSAAKQFLHPGTDLSGVQEPGSKIVIQRYYNAFIEAEALADKIMRHHTEGVPFGSIAVFYRLQKQSYVLEEVFGRKGIPCQNSVRKSLKDMPILLWLTRLLRASVNPNDQGSLAATLADARYGPGLKPAQIKKITAGNCDLYDLIKGFTAWAQKNGSAEGIYTYFGLEERLSPTSVSFQKDKSLVLQFLNRLDQTVQSYPSFLTGCAGFINAASLYSPELPDQADGCDDCVHLMTLHACKGLEFPYVFIIGVNYGLIPLLRANSQDEEEEKRLFFVGITRAMNALELSYYTDPEPRVLSGESPYLSMIPEHLAERTSKQIACVNLQVLRRAVLDNRPIPASPIGEPARTSSIKVRHPKYGLGTLLAQDSELFTVLFEDYGEKKLAKQFCPLEFPED